MVDYTPFQKKVQKAHEDIDIIIVSGTGIGKSFLASTIFQPVMDDPKSKVLVSRRAIPQLINPYGLWAQACSFVPNGTEVLRPHLKHVYPSKATAYFKTFPQEENVFDIAGLQYTRIILDQAEQFSKFQIRYMMTRLRSCSKYDSKMLLLATAKQGDSFLKELIDWYLDEEGYPIPEREEVTTYFCFKDEELLTSTKKEDLINRGCSRPLKITYLSGKFEDNLYLSKDYVKALQSLPKEEYNTLANNCWGVKSRKPKTFIQKVKEWISRRFE